MESKDIRSIQEAYSLICETASPQRTPSGGTVSQKTQRDPNTRATAPTSASDRLGKLNKKNFPAPKPLEELAMPRSREFEKRLPTPTPPRSREFEQRLPKPAPPRSREFEKRLPAPTLKNSADLFDIVKGHLLDEGFAETEESAIAIMANMSEEWRNSILEFFGPKPVTPKPGESGSGTKSVMPGTRYPAKLNGQPVMKVYDKTGGSTTKPMTTGEKIRTYRQHSTAY